MSKTWLISDTHFGHTNVYKFTDDQGNLQRQFIDPFVATCPEEGDELMVHWWNTLISPEDRVYHLGDIAIPRKSLKILERLNGRKALVRGNHDPWKLKDLTPYFDNIYGTRKLSDFIITHYPIHPDSIPHWCKAVIHGHTHKNIVKLPNGQPDDRYYNVCVEQTGGKPMDFEDVKKEIERVQNE